MVSLVVSFSFPPPLDRARTVEYKHGRTDHLQHRHQSLGTSGLERWVPFARSFVQR